MKKAISTILLVGLLMFFLGACGGNVSKVKNGVFPDFDSSITVGQVFANDTLLSGGKWEAYKRDGREIVSYTVRFTPSQIQTQYNSNDARPNFAVANRLYGNYNGLSLEGEERQEFINVFESIFLPLRERPIKEEVNRVFDIDATVYIDPELIEKISNFMRKWGWGMYISEDSIVEEIEKIMQRSGWSSYHSLSELGSFLIRYGDYSRHSSGREWQIEHDELLALLKQLADKYELLYMEAQAAINEAEDIANERFAVQLAAWESQDIEPLVTVTGGSITFYFVMDQANKDAFSIGGMHRTQNLTLNCFNNRRVTHEREFYINDILQYIYRPSSRRNIFI